MKKKPNPILLSDMYWCFGMILTTLFTILHYVVEDDWLYLLSAGIFYVLTLTLNHNEKVRNSLDYG